jgi:hypothetical protein
LHAGNDAAHHREAHHAPAVSRESSPVSSHAANRVAQSGGAPFTSQIGLNITYVRPAAFSAGEENSRRTWTRGEKS